MFPPVFLPSAVGLVVARQLLLLCEHTALQLVASMHVLDILHASIIQYCNIQYCKKKYVEHGLLQTNDILGKGAFKTVYKGFDGLEGLGELLASCTSSL